MVKCCEQYLFLAAADHTCLLSLRVSPTTSVKDNKSYWLTARCWHCGWAKTQWLSLKGKYTRWWLWLSCSPSVLSLTHSRLRPVTCCWDWTSPRCWAVWLLWIKWQQVSQNMCTMCVSNMMLVGSQTGSHECVGAECRYQVPCIYIVPFLFRYRRGQWFSVRPALFSPSHQVVRVAVLSGFAGPVLQAAAEPISQSGMVNSHEQHSLGTQWIRVEWILTLWSF